MKIATRVFKWIILLLSVLIAFVSICLIWIYLNPERVLEFFRSRYFQDSPQITWSALDLDIDYMDGLKFRLMLDVTDLKILDETPFINIQIPSLRYDATLDLPRRKVLISRLELHAEDSHFTLSPPQPSETRKSPSEKNIFQWIQSIIRPLSFFDKSVQVENLLIEIKKFQLYASDRKPLVEITLYARTASRNQIVFRTDVSRPHIKNPVNLGLKGQLNLRNLDSHEPLLLSDLRFTGYNLKADTHVTIIHEHQTIRILARGPLYYETGTLKLFSNPEASLDLSETQADLRIHTAIRGLPGLIPQVEDLKARITTPLKTDQLWSLEPSSFHITSPIELIFIKPNLRRTLEKSCECRFPLRQMAEAKGQLWLAHLLSESSKKLPILRSRISMESYANKLLEMALAANIDIDKYRGEFQLQPILDSEVKVHKFHDLQPLFQTYRIFLPAPLEVLDGLLYFEARGPVSRNSEGSRFPLNLKTDLKSEKQSVKTDTRAQITISRDFKKVHFETKVKIDSLQLELPPLNPAGGVPRVTADRRIQRAPSKVSPSGNNFRVTFNLKVETPRPGNIRLLSEYFKPYIPLTLHMESRGRDDLSGSLNVEPFQVTYLKRQVYVERVHVGLETIGNGGLPVKGRLRVEQTLYTIYVDILGNTKNPAITLTSEPYLPESEIISVLLYDRTSDQLISADAQTAGSVQAAIADRAIGLLGLWIFASTPIRSFHYNPVTHIYTATVVLAGNVTAGIGSDWESATHVELYKRISKRWLLTARWVSNSPDEPENSELVLQWERRF